ncbi:hypothetical protein DFQ30_008845 [Apophysomyces sp. BC1015]|nr:hypothetical protein DFQ30_008845 [Apophysomyces sp. BC1015]KAG0173741.1 hypothetical protein DFQ29_007771 [Apophysomyces sp. BC1021]
MEGKGADEEMMFESYHTACPEFCARRLKIQRIVAVAIFFSRLEIREEALEEKVLVEEDMMQYEVN